MCACCCLAELAPGCAFLGLGCGQFKASCLADVAALSPGSSFSYFFFCCALFLLQPRRASFRSLLASYLLVFGRLLVGWTKKSGVAGRGDILFCFFSLFCLLLLLALLTRLTVVCAPGGPFLRFFAFFIIYIYIFLLIKKTYLSLTPHIIFSPPARLPSYTHLLRTPAHLRPS